MPGLSIGIGGGRALGGSPGVSQSAGATIAQTAYGVGSTGPQGGAAGVEQHQTFLFAEGASLAFLVGVYWAAPPPLKAAMRLDAMVIIPALILWGGAGVWSRRRLIEGPSRGFLHGTALFVKSVTP